LLDLARHLGLKAIGTCSAAVRTSPSTPSALAIEMRDDDVVERLYNVARHDWEHSHPLDLSDEGLLADLNERAGEAAKLGLVDADPGKKS
jgi:hypothetical protein